LLLVLLLFRLAVMMLLLLVLAVVVVAAAAVTFCKQTVMTLRSTRQHSTSMQELARRHNRAQLP
jgi:hypothetical protein